MNARLLDPDTGLDAPGLAEDTGCARLSPEVSRETAPRNNHLDSGRPEGGTEDVEDPWGRPFAP